MCGCCVLFPCVDVVVDTDVAASFLHRRWLRALRVHPRTLRVFVPRHQVRSRGARHNMHIHTSAALLPVVAVRGVDALRARWHGTAVANELTGFLFVRVRMRMCMCGGGTERQVLEECPHGR